MPRTSDQPWGATVAALGSRRFTGQLRLHPEHPQHCIAFDRGVIVGATSPLAIDSLARVALHNHVIAPTQITEIQRRVAAAPKRDEIEVLSEVVRLAPERAIEVRRKLVSQRAARTFSLDATYVFEDRLSIPRHATCEVDVRAVVYLGALQHLSAERLAHDLRRYATRWKLKASGIRELASFQFPDTAFPILETLRSPTSLPELEAIHRDVDPRQIQAMVYALLACEACDAAPPRAAPRGTTEGAPLERMPRGTSEPATLARTPKAGTAAAPTEPARSSTSVRVIISTDPTPVAKVPVARLPRGTEDPKRAENPRRATPPLGRVQIPESIADKPSRPSALPPESRPDDKPKKP